MRATSEESQLAFNAQTAFAKLEQIQQGHLLRYWTLLDQTEQAHLCRQISQIDLTLFNIQQLKVASSRAASHALTPTPFTPYFVAGNLQNQQRGRHLVEEGRVALLVLAGGQGSRLRCRGPKGCSAITPITEKSLFQFLSERVAAASRLAGIALEIAIMTSPLNHAETVAFFADQDFFGLDPSQISFFPQQMWPLLDFESNLFLEAMDRVAHAPNGNGGVFRCLVESGIWEKWHRLGIEMVNVIPIDNPLADPFDFELFGFHTEHQCDVTVKGTWRRDIHEKVGVLVKTDPLGSPAIIEYSELSYENKGARDLEGNLRFEVANLGLYCLSLSFIHRVSKQYFPLHAAKKVVPMWSATGQMLPLEPNAWKFEEFIFDAFPLAHKLEALLYPRESCFAPLKNLQGEDSIDTVQASLLAFNRQVFARVTGRYPPEEAIFEVAAQFYYPTQELLNTWTGRSFPHQEVIDE